MIANITFSEPWLNSDMLIMIALLFIFLVLYLVTKYQTNKLTKDVERARGNLKKTGEKIQVNYHDLEIKKNCWIQEIEVDSDLGSKKEYVNINLNLIIFKKKHRGHLFN